MSIKSCASGHKGGSAVFPSCILLISSLPFRYAQYKGEGFQGLWSFKLDFPDAGSVSDWAAEAISWMVMNGVINGTTDGNGAVILDPQGGATRAQIAAMIQRFCEKTAK